MAVLLLLPGSSAMNPLLYTAKNASTTGFHQDLAATGDLTRTDGSSILDDCAASLNLTGPIVHNIRLRDLQSAESGVEQYVETAGKLRDVVLRFDANDTDLATFEEENLANAWSLRALLNQTRAYGDLQAAEATWREQRNVSGLKSVELLGADLRVQIRDNYDEYAARSTRIIGIARKLGLDPSAFEQSVTDFAAILVDIDAEQAMRESSIPKAISEITASGKGSGTDDAASDANAIGLTILPDRGVYGDTLSMAGTLSAPAGTEVTIFVDGRKVGGAATDRDGRFSLPYRIERLEARNHTAYAATASEVSDVGTFTVDGGNTTVSLAVRIVEEDGTSTCIGTGRVVTERDVPVRGARVDLDVDGPTSSGYGITGDDGKFTATAEELAPGTHTVKAGFHPDGHPLNASESASQAVVAQSHYGWIAAVVYLLGVGGAAIGGVLFLRKRQPAETLPSTGSVEEAPASPAAPSPVPTLEEAQTIADQATVISDGRINRYETVVSLYRMLVQELEARNPGIRLRSRTPRGLALLFADRSWGAEAAVLVGIHEKVRYAEREPTDHDLRRMREAFVSILTEGCRD